MLVATVVCFAALMVVTGILLRTRVQVQELSDRLRNVTDERDEARAGVAEATATAAAARRERDDALERVQRARRDAAEVAGRLRDETTARSTAEAAAQDAGQETERLRTEVEALTAELRAAEAELAAAPTGDEADDLVVLWELAIGRVERTWRTSIALHAEERSPLERSDDSLRVAVEVLVDAAREEAGADIELAWSGTTADVPARRAVVVLEVVEAIVATVAKVATRTQLAISATGATVEIEVVTDDGAGGPLRLDIPAQLEAAPGRYVLG